MLRETHCRELCAGWCWWVVAIAVARGETTRLARPPTGRPRFRTVGHDKGRAGQARPYRQQGHAGPGASRHGFAEDKLFWNFAQQCKSKNPTSAGGGRPS
jgi:hypothetical protein